MLNALIFLTYLRHSDTDIILSFELLLHTLISKDILCTSFFNPLPPVQAVIACDDPWTLIETQIVLLMLTLAPSVFNLVSWELNIFVLLYIAVTVL